MKVPIIAIGNSKGLRLSKTILERYNIKDNIELVLEKNRIILKPVDEPRKGWKKAFENIRKHGEDELLIPDVFEDENFDE